MSHSTQAHADAAAGADGHGQGRGAAAAGVQEKERRRKRAYQKVTGECLISMLSSCNTCFNVKGGSADPISTRAEEAVQGLQIGRHRISS